MKELKAWAKRHHYDFSIIYRSSLDLVEIGIVISCQRIDDQGDAMPDYSKRNAIINQAYKKGFRYENRAHYEAIALYA